MPSPTDQFIYVIEWEGRRTEPEGYDTASNSYVLLEAQTHKAVVRSSEGGMEKLLRYMKRAPNVREFTVDVLSEEPTMTVQEFIDMRRGE